MQALDIPVEVKDKLREVGLLVDNTLTEGRTCTDCKWCQTPDAPLCNWRIGMYAGDKHPRRSKVVLYALDPKWFEGAHVVVAQPFPQRHLALSVHDDPQEEVRVPAATLKWLSVMALRTPVVVLDKPLRDGGKIRAVLTQDSALRMFILVVLRSWLPQGALERLGEFAHEVASPLGDQAEPDQGVPGEAAGS